MVILVNTENAEYQLQFHNSYTPALELYLLEEGPAWNTRRVQLSR